MNTKQKPKGLSRREFARLAECSESTVRRHIRLSWLECFADGTLDPDDVEEFADHIGFNRIANGAWLLR